MPGIGAILDEMDDDETTDDSFKLLLPSEFSVDDRNSLCPPDISALEFRFRYAQADDSLAELRRLLRLKRNLRDENTKHPLLAQKSVTRTKGIFNSFEAKINRSANRYSHARSAMLALDPDQKIGPGWIKRFQTLDSTDVRGPGREPDNTSEGQFKPSWIWLIPRLSHPPPLVTTPSGGRVATTPSNGCVATTPSVDGSTGENDPESTDSMCAHWAKCQARAERYEEEVALILEEMGRTLRYFEWKQSWWLSLQSQRGQLKPPPPVDVQRGLQAYALRQANIFDSLIMSFARKWRKTLLFHNLSPPWLSRYPATQDHSQPEPNPESPLSSLQPSGGDEDMDVDVSDDDDGNDDGGDDGDDAGDDDGDDAGDDDEYLVDGEEGFDLEDEFMS